MERLFDSLIMAKSRDLLAFVALTVSAITEVQGSCLRCTVLQCTCLRCSRRGCEATVVMKYSVVVGKVI